MSDTQAALRRMPKRHEFLVAIDSDGCAFDSMEIKHKECFIPNTIKHWGLQPVSKYARAAAEFVNLYSKWRGLNRFPALVRTFDLLREWPEVQERRATIPAADSLREWSARESRLSNASLKAEVERTGDPVLRQALAWSEGVNASVEEMVKDVPPFPHVAESLAAIASWADVIVCSATPTAALEREWTEHGLAAHVSVIAGQEMGSKREHIQAAHEGRYDKRHVLMIGDALGDLQAAKDNGVLFFPIDPGLEQQCWETFLRDASKRLHDGRYAGEYEGRRIAEFAERLPDAPPWKK